MPITIPTPDTADLKKLLEGKKTYLVLAVGAAVIAANHFGLLPPDMAHQVNLDPQNWINDEYKLLTGATGRAALAGIKSAVEQYLAALNAPAAPPDHAGGPSSSAG